MKNWFKIYLDLIIIYVATLIIALTLFIFLGEKIEIIGAVLATGISLAFGFRQYTMENDKMFKELFGEFNRKYDSKFNDKLNKIDAFIKVGNQLVLEDSDKLIIIDYLNFCSEEYLWYSKGRIPEIVWNSWENGMIYFLNLKPINEVVLTQKKQKTSYYGLFEKLGKRLKTLE